MIQFIGDCIILQAHDQGTVPNYVLDFIGRASPSQAKTRFFQIESHRARALRATSVQLGGLTPAACRGDSMMTADLDHSLEIIVRKW